MDSVAVWRLVMGKTSLKDAVQKDVSLLQQQPIANNLVQGAAAAKLRSNDQLKLTSSREIRGVLRKGFKAVSKEGVVLANPGQSRFAVVASRKFGSAVIRNRFKRQVREYFRNHCRDSGLDVVVIARRGSIGIQSRDLSRSLERCLNRLMQQNLCRP